MPIFSHQTAHSGIERSKTTMAKSSYRHILSQLGTDLRCWEGEPVQIGAGFLNMMGIDISFSEEIPCGTPEQYYGGLFIGNHKPNVEPYIASCDATFEIFSYNSHQNPYYGGRRKPEDYWKPFTSPTFTDGSIGKTDPTLMPQFYDRHFPSLPFNTKTSMRFDNRKVVTCLPTVSPKNGTLTPSFLGALKFVHSWESLLPSIEEICDLGTLMLFSTYVPKMAAIQRRFKIAESWTTMSDVLIQKQVDTGWHLSVTRCKMQDEHFMGIWGNGMDLQMLKWYLYIAQVPVFWLHWQVPDSNEELPSDIPKFMNLIEGTAMSSYLADAQNLKIMNAAGDLAFFQTKFLDESIVKCRNLPEININTRSFPSPEPPLIVSDPVPATNTPKTGLMDLSRYMSALELGVKRIVLEINDEDEDDEIEIVSGPVKKTRKVEEEEEERKAKEEEEQKVKEEETEVHFSGLELEDAVDCSGTALITSVNGDAIQVVAELEDLCLTLLETVEDHASDGAMDLTSLINAGMDKGVVGQQPDQILRTAPSLGRISTSVNEGGFAKQQSVDQMVSQLSNTSVSLTTATVESVTLKRPGESQSFENPKHPRFDPGLNPNNHPSHPPLKFTVSKHPTAFLVVKGRNEQNIFSFIQFVEQYTPVSKFRPVPPTMRKRRKNIFLTPETYKNEVEKSASDANWCVVTTQPPPPRHQTTLRHRARRKITAKKQEWGDDVDREGVKNNVRRRQYRRQHQEQSNGRSDYHRSGKEKKWERRGPSHAGEGSRARDPYAIGQSFWNGQ
ncbi:hypothetical protein BT96DRAFT_1007267 [Gymnopus androsaceus JB14]|uniref:Uncharacterized protein n=1 Tax=Gymnopus androsaceus JB14 TaxID=1447944 RepID=A0A6A4GI37_9AGAR|nr:hypothetical protein BT96DRAFT_1007267 [Gymnopus androsaceus JB14]